VVADHNARARPVIAYDRFTFIFCPGLARARAAPCTSAAAGCQGGNRLGQQGQERGQRGPILVCSSRRGLRRWCWGLRRLWTRCLRCGGLRIYR
jgi:hypothetical protein